MRRCNRADPPRTNRTTPVRRPAPRSGRLRGRLTVLGAAIAWIAGALLAAPPHARAAELAELVHRVEVPDARALAVHDGANMLIVARSSDQGGQLLAFPLDDAGRVRDGERPSPVALPRPEALADYPHHPLALAVHPEQAVVYVWQDMTDVPADDAQMRERVRADFPHLILYEMNDQGLTQIGAFATGSAFAFGQREAALAVSGDGARLFIPNFHNAPDDQPQWAGGLGYFDLDAQGRLVPVPVPIEGSLDGRGINEFEMRIKPTFIYTGFHRQHAVDRPSREMARLPIRSAFAPSQRTVVFGTRTGIGVWDTVDRRQALSEVNIADVTGEDRYIAGHPRLPLLYIADRGGHVITRLHHVEGFPTLLPERTRAQGLDRNGFQSAPVPCVAADSDTASALAIGGHEQLYLLPLDEQGQVARAAQTVPIQTQRPVRALDYSSRHHRLYVAVDEIPSNADEQSQD